jgi:hypothetical protein
MIERINADLARLKEAYERRLAMLPGVGTSFPVP